MFRFTQTIIRELSDCASPKLQCFIGYIYRYLKLSVLWLHILFGPIMRVDRAQCGVPLHTVPITSNNDICNRYQHCNFSEAQADSSLMMVYVNRNMSEQLL